MQGRTTVLFATLMFAVALMVTASAAPAAELPEGVSFTVLAEFSSDIPGIEKVQLQELRLQPGAKWENILVADTGYWTAIKGQLTVVSGGKTVVYGPGSRWKVTKGMKASIYNNGTEPHAHQIWRLITSKWQWIGGALGAFVKRDRVLFLSIFKGKMDKVGDPRKGLGPKGFSG